MSWSGFNTAVSGLFGSQRKLYTVNHNVANASKEGYSRQKVSESSSIPRHLPGIGYIGTGVNIDSVDRVRDIYLDKKYRTEVGSLGEWNAKNMGLNEIEGVLRGGKEEGINVSLDDFFKTIEDLSTNPSDLAYRTSFKEKANTVATNLNETVARLYKQQKDINFEVKTKVKEINDFADQIRALNSQIFVMEVDGHKANDLRDQRDIIVDKLSKIVNVEAEERIVNLEESKQKGKIEVRQFEVRIGGISLVNHNMVSKLKDPPDLMENTLNPEELLYKVEWESGGDVVLKGGELKGLLEIRDGGDKLDTYNGIPYYMERLNEFAQGIFAKINEIHFKGTNLNGDKNKLLFSINGKDTDDNDISTIIDALKAIPKKPDSTDVDYDVKMDEYNLKYKEYKDAIKNIVGAGNISLSGDIISDLNNIATIDGDGEDKENNKILKELLKAREDTTFFDATAKYQGKPEDYLTSILSTLGTDGQQSERMGKVQKLIVEGTTNQRLSVSGVNLDEEMADMVKLQQLYNASARMITTFDQIFETTINRLGLVGR